VDVPRALSLLGGITWMVPVLWCLAAAGPTFAQPMPQGSTVTPRADFRPLSRAEDKAAFQPRRLFPPARARTMHNAAGRLPDITGGRISARKAMPITRGQELGLRFRPDKREPVQGSYLEPLDQPLSNQPQSQFRPLASRRKPTYEELESQREAPGQPAPAAPFVYGPFQPPPLAPFGMPLRPW